MGEKQAGNISIIQNMWVATLQALSLRRCHIYSELQVLHA